MVKGVTTGVDRTRCDGLHIRPSTSRGTRRERTVRYMAGLGTGVRYGVHCDNLKNMARGIVERVLYVVRDGRLVRPPQPKQCAFARLSSIRRRLLAVLRPTPVVPLDEFPLLYNGRKKAVYERAVASLKARDVTRRDAWCSTFLKAEKINFDAKGDPAPRVIQPCHPRYNAALGVYLKPFEKVVLNAFEVVFGYRVVLKGLNATETASVMRSNWESFSRPVAVGLDASRFDQHVSKLALQWEHSVYNGAFRCKRLARLLKWQLDNHGVARVDGFRVDYHVEGGRMSGIINTGLGNCLLMSSFVLSYVEHHGIKARLSNNGDDCVLMVEQCDLHKLGGLDEWMLDYGITLTKEPPVDVFERIEFCQCQPVYTSTGWRMVRNIWTAPSKDCVSIPGWDDHEAIQAWARNISGCGLALTTGVPVWEAWYGCLATIGAGARIRGEGLEQSGMRFMAAGVIGGRIVPEARVSFYRAFGITPDQQVALEQEYRRPIHLQPLTPLTSSHVKAIDIAENPLAALKLVQ